MSGLGSSSRFSTRTVDKPQVPITSGLLGNLYAPRPPKQKIDVHSSSSEVDVWPQATPTVDPSRVDRAQSAFRAKLESMNGVTHANRFDQMPEDSLRKFLLSASTKRNGRVEEDAFVELLVRKFNFAGFEADVRALFRRYDIHRRGELEVMELASAILGKGRLSQESTIGRIREVLAKRAGGSSTLKSLGLQFKLMDRSNDGTVDREELQIGFEKFLRGFGVTLGPVELQNVFALFDVNGDGVISYDEFICGVRGSMSEARLALVREAFDLLDMDASGGITLDEVAAVYDVTLHPMVKAGKMTAEEALRVFMKQWGDKDGDGIITLPEFVEYYEWVSASIDTDQYFELMMRNAWRISGGIGAAQNTANLRVLVKHADGRQTVETLRNELGLRRNDLEDIKRRLRAQGVNAVSVSITGNV
eukprot:TRINITY_DN400_c1_g12_i1.p1 TRINITY_DN400_c1_g12~~TRINITY_DN400_c1_g12_i1.p1  ORF type:complete len:419 (-),score=144.48 TRINITY_DN400_c1_g12_i1:255-1511(-)